MFFGPKMMAGAAGLDVSKLFKTVLFTGSARANTGLGFAPDLVWLKSRNSSGDHYITDRVRGAAKTLWANSSGAEYTAATVITSFDADGFTTGPIGTQDWVAWCLKRAARFFDIVTWTGDGSADRRIAHSLGVVPGLVLAKRLDTDADWAVTYVAGAQEVAQNSFTAISLNNTDQRVSGYDYANDPTVHSATHIRINSAGYLSNKDQQSQNVSGGSYVSLVFANDASPDSVIRCGMFVGSYNMVVDVGFRPQFLLFRNKDVNNHWRILDTARGIFTGAPDNQLLVSANFVEAENELVEITDNGFKWVQNTGGIDIIYLAIRAPAA
jgi:hypothetical protein